MHDEQRDDHPTLVEGIEGGKLWNLTTACTKMEAPGAMPSADFQCVNSVAQHRVVF